MLYARPRVHKILILYTTMSLLSKIVIIFYNLKIAKHA